MTPPPHPPAHHGHRGPLCGGESRFQCLPTTPRSSAIQPMAPTCFITLGRRCPGPACPTAGPTAVHPAAHPPGTAGKAGARLALAENTPAERKHRPWHRYQQHRHARPWGTAPQSPPPPRRGDRGHGYRMCCRGTLIHRRTSSRTARCCWRPARDMHRARVLHSRLGLDCDDFSPQKKRKKAQLHVAPRPHTRHGLCSP